jgi:hypothetical protein
MDFFSLCWSVSRVLWHDAHISCSRRCYSTFRAITNSIPVGRCQSPNRPYATSWPPGARFPASSSTDISNKLTCPSELSWNCTGLSLAMSMCFWEYIQGHEILCGMTAICDQTWLTHFLTFTTSKTSCCKAFMSTPCSSSDPRCEARMTLSRSLATDLVGPPAPVAATCAVVLLAMSFPIFCKSDDMI